MPCKVQPLLPSIGLELYQLGVHFLAKKKKKKKIYLPIQINFTRASLALSCLCVAISSEAAN